jgi:hypothetical protein
VHELRDGRVVVLDASEQRVLVVDFAKSTALQIGRIGSGPGEYRLPRRLLMLGGDSIGIADLGNRRLVVITGNGKLSGVLGPLGMPLGNAVSARGALPVASDSEGRLYALGYTGFAPAASLQSDSAPIERWRLGSSIRDTVAYLPLPPIEQRVLPRGEGTHAFTTEPQWAVGPDGQVAILHLSPFAVDVIDTKGTRVKGRPITYRPIPVTNAHKRQWRDDQSWPRPVMIMTPGATIPTPGLRSMPQFEPIHWPDVLPPFLDDAIHFAPDRFLWIQRTTSADDPPVFDIVSFSGIVVEQVKAPPHTRLVGFSRSYVYLARSDPDDQEFLERYRAIARRRP